MKVLHIEDRAENRLLVRKVLEARGHQVIDCVDGLTGLELARLDRPDLILVDLNIPTLNGYEVVSRLKNEVSLAGVPVVAITAEGDRERALALGFDGFLAKPIRPANFEAQLLAFKAGLRERGDEQQRAEHLLAHSQQVANRLEEKLRELTRANERLSELDRLKLEVLRNVSHELATPLTPIMGYLQLLLGGSLGALTEPQRQILNRVEGSVGRLQGVIEALLTMTRFAMGTLSLTLAVCTAREVIAGAVAANRAKAQAKGIALSVAQDELEPVVADERRLGEALGGLIDNAIKFSPEGGRVVVSAQAQLSAEGRWWQVSVCDGGPGIPPELRERVLKPFYQVDGSPTRAQGGTGLGLAIAARIAELHGGALILGAPGGPGFCVALRLPMRPAQDERDA